MFKDIQTWTQKKLVGMSRGLTVLYFLLTFIAPIVTIIVMFCQNGDIGYKFKVPIIGIIVVIAIIFACTRFFKKAISKMKILNVDGTYNRSSQITKHALECLSNLIIPVTLLIVSIIVGTALVEWLDFYNLMIIICLSFYVAGIVIDRFLLSFLDDELSIREELAQSNAIELRKNSDL